MAKRKHRTTYQKANAALEAEGHRQCGILYGSTALALCRHWSKGRVAILKPELFIDFEKNKKTGSHMNDVALYRQKQKSHYFYT